jgi:hypothetical protein
MKKKVKQYAEQIQGGSQHPRHVLKDFSRMLDTQIFTGRLSIDYLVHLRFALLQNVIATRNL